MSGDANGLGAALFALFALFIVFWFVVLLPAGMARRRNRSALVWVAISIVGSPILAMLLLIAMSNDSKNP